MAGLADITAGNDGWASSVQQIIDAINDGFFKYQTLDNADGSLDNGATFISATTFSVAGDRTTLFTKGRRLRIVSAAGTHYCSVFSSSFASPTTTITIHAITSGPTSMTTPLTSVALGLDFHGAAGNGTVDENFARLMTTWGL